MFMAHNRNNMARQRGPCSRDHLHTEHIEIQSRLCTACGNCINKCPREVIGKVKWFKHQHAHIDSANDCIGCKKCVKACPNGAIIEFKRNEVQTESKAKANNQEHPSHKQNPALLLTYIS